MKKKIYIVLFLALVLGLFLSIKQVNCSDSKYFLAPKSEIKHIKDKRSYLFKMNNLDDKSFGFTMVESDQALGARNILISGDFAYLSDPYHGNIKKIDIKTGIISSSNVLTTNKYLSIRSICFFNQLLYVFSDNEEVFILNTDLNLEKKFKMETKYKGIKDIYNVMIDTITIYRPIDDVQQLNNGRMQISMIKISKSNSISKDTIYFPDYESYSALLNNIRGLQYQEIKENEHWYLLTPYGKYELPEQIPSTSKYYDSKNMDFTNDKVIFFSTTPDKIAITVSEY